MMANHLCSRALGKVLRLAKSGMYAPPMEPPALDAFYKARRTLSELVNAERHALSMQLQPGDCLLFDNMRLLHARSEIQPSDGAGWVQDGLVLNYNRLRRRAPQQPCSAFGARPLSGGPASPTQAGSIARHFSGTARGQPSHDKFDYQSMMRAHRDAGGRIQPKLVPLAERAKDSVFDLAFVQRLLVGKYSNYWMGEPLMKDAVSLDLYLRLMAAQRPGTIFDLGTCGGGSALWFSSMAKSMGLDNTVILTCDIQDMRSAASKELMKQAGNVSFLLGDLGDGEGLFRAAERLGYRLPKPWLIAEDCHLDTQVILRCFEGRLCKGDYIVFEDTHPLHPDGAYMHAEDPDNYVTGNFAVEKYRLMEQAMLAAGDEWAVDASIQDAYGHNGATFINSVFVKV